MSDFTKLSKAVRKQYDEMSKDTLLFKVDVDKDLFYETYLNSFPEGTNPIFRERTEHDCSCCRNFIKNLGSVVAIKHDKIVTVWDIDIDEHPYNIVAEKMKEFVLKQDINSVYFTRESKYGNEFNLELKEDDTTYRWNHFVGHIDRKHIHHSPAEKIGQFNSEFQVMKRSLEELTMCALETVLDLINNNSLYRGQEHLSLVKAFIEQKRAYDNYKHNNKDLFLWQNLGKGSVNRFRNTVIGTLVSDLSEGVELEKAVKMFESKVAPANYKRPKALITQRMVKDAMKTIKELGLEPALDRRYATFSDVSVNDVLFVDNSVKDQLIDGLEAELLSTVSSQPVNVKNSIDIDIDEFISSVLPKAHEIEALVKGSNMGNFVSVTAPSDPNVENLFNWDNNFAWSYDGDVADSDIKSKVKAAGGDVNALLRCSLAWFNYDDLDIRARLPSGRVVSYSDKAGILDIDMNVSPNTREAVENLRWNKHNLKDGTYIISVHNYTKRESKDVGFTLEVDYNGVIQTFHYDKMVKHNEVVRSLELKVKDHQLISVKTLNPNITHNCQPQDKWGIKTETFTKVSSVILSPNYWEGNQFGNKHWFFILDNCVNPEKTRGIYNEFLKPELTKHRKVFEIIGEKTKCDFSEDQLSGVGFSSTKKDELTVKVKSDKMQQIYNIKF